MADKVDLLDLARTSDLLLIRATTHEPRTVQSGTLLFNPKSVWDLNFAESSEDTLVFDSSDGRRSFGLRSSASKRDFSDATVDRAVVIDITGFDHSQWSWLVKVALESRASSIAALYIEPESYTFSESPIGGEFFELSERIKGINPLPGFATLRPSRDAFVFVPLLGFEGPRFTYMIEQVQPNQTLTYPVIGVPGFQVDFPFFTVQGNRRALLKEEGIWGNRRFVRANCPAGAYAILDDIRQQHRDKLIKIAPIGTKPHALGAVLFKIHNESSVDLVYDHPVRKPGRTSGASSALLYNLDLYRLGP